MRRPAMLLIKIVILVLVNQISSEKCDHTGIGDEFYKRQLVAAIDGYPTGMVVHPITENIYFRLHKKNFTKGIYVLKYGSLGIKQLPISEEFIGQCVGIDAEGNILIGTNQGMLTYNENMNEINSDRPIGDDDLRNIYFDKNNQMHITIGHTHEVYKFLNASLAIKRNEKVPKAYNFVLDSEGNSFYEYIDGKLYFFSKDLYEPVQYKGFTRELSYILNINNNNQAIVAVKGSVFKLTTESILPKKMADLGFRITGFAFDNKNNILVGTQDKIYRYKPVDKNDPCPPDDYFMSNI